MNKTVINAIPGALVLGVSAMILTPLAAMELQIDGVACGTANQVTSTSSTVQVSTNGGLACNGPNPPPIDPPIEPPPIEPPPAHVKVVRPGAGMTFLPQCVNGVHWANTNCEFQGSITADQIWAIEVDNSAGSTTSYQYAQVSRSETGDYPMAYEIAVSTTPGEFNVPRFCKSNSKVTTAWEGTNVRNACLVPLSTLYVNIRVGPAPERDSCGRGITCRPKIFGSFIY